MMTDFIRAMEEYGTSHKLAEDSGIPVQTIKRIKSGETEFPGINTIVTLATVMDVSMDEMFGLGRAESMAMEAHKANPALPCHGHGSCSIVRQLRDVYEGQVRYHRKIIRTLACVCGILIVFVLALFAYDLLNPAFGWFRYQAMHGIKMPHISLFGGKFDSFL